MGGKPCIRGMRVTVGMVVGLVASGYSREKILEAYPYLEEGDITEALMYAAWGGVRHEPHLFTGFISDRSPYSSIKSSIIPFILSNREGR